MKLFRIIDVSLENDLTSDFVIVRPFFEKRIFQSLQHGERIGGDILPSIDLADQVHFG